ncbi:hypothetical protein QE152_g6928 [Popillia japonica]|uniref:Uncharacterized protein n=1 Tax=Popillia japonica TaxID=7064 RepID=A0AAW1MGH7_POPJA
MKFRKEKCQGDKKSKERITVFICVWRVPKRRMEGTEKTPLLIIGESQTCRCFKSSLVVLPPNAAAALQSMDQNIIAGLKQYYKTNVLCRMIACLDENKDFNFTLLDEFSHDDVLPLTYWILKHKDSEAVDEDSLTLHDWAITNDLFKWAITNDLFKGSLNLELFNTFQEVDDDVLTCAYPSKLQITAAVAKT